MNGEPWTITAVDLFCGVGGLTHGFRRAGIRVVAGIDLDAACQFAYERNNAPSRFVKNDVKSLEAQELLDLFGDAKVKLLAGCAPCQPFSTYSRSDRRKRGGESDDGEWSLVSSFGRLVRQVQPDLVTMENVPQLLLHKVFKNFLRALHGYYVEWSVFDCERIGVPQTRIRTHCLSQKMTVAASEMALMKVWAHRS